MNPISAETELPEDTRDEIRLRAKNRRYNGEPTGSLPLDDPREEAFAVAVAKGSSKTEAALAAGYSPKAVSSAGTRTAKRPRVRRRIDFLASKVAEKVVVQVSRVADLQIASRNERCKVYNDIYQRILQVIKERGEDPTMAKVPGGKSGLVVRQWKVIGTGREQKALPEYVTDVALMRELRAHAQQASEELGQWREDTAAESAVQKAPFPTWLMEQWSDRGSTGPSEVSDNSTPSDVNIRASRVRSDQENRVH